MATIKNKILNSLKNGNEVSAKQFAARFGTSTATVSARVADLRSEGYSIYSNLRTDAKGRQTNKYRIGTPTRATVAAGYAVLGAQ
jgi:predicted ArsR family transcriptional regulator|tara:strand:+ start:218 stop:472 length:255 start_codon:yes stop_codon:yes gene_type:complete